MNNIHNVDLNLLVILDALLREGSATAAARRLSRTQSAISHALARLRDTFEDPLFVRVGTSLKPTPRAEALRAPIADLLDRAAGLLRDRETFEPSTLARTFVVASTDLLENTAFASLMEELARAAPHVSVVTRNPGSDMERALQSRDIDVAYVTRLTTEAGIALETLFEDKLQLLLRRGHPALRKPIDLDAYCSLRHVLVAPRGAPGGPVDELLHARGRSRHVALRTPSFTAALRVVAASDLVTALPSRYAKMAARSVVARPLPLPPTTFTFRLAWSVALDEDPAHKWFRELLRRAILAAFRVENRAPIA